jgi:hypothetical protein
VFQIATFLVPEDTCSILSNRMPRIKGKKFGKSGEMWQKIYNWGHWIWKNQLKVL